MLPWHCDNRSRLNGSVGSTSKRTGNELPADPLIVGDPTQRMGSARNRTVPKTYPSYFAQPLSHQGPRGGCDVDTCCKARARFDASG